NLVRTAPGLGPEQRCVSVALTLLATDADPAVAAQELVAAALWSVPTADRGSVTVIDGGAPRNLACTDATVHAFEALQPTVAAGPFYEVSLAVQALDVADFPSALHPEPVVGAAEAFGISSCICFSAGGIDRDDPRRWLVALYRSSDRFSPLERRQAAVLAQA